MYSKSTSDRSGELNIPGNYSGNAFRLQSTTISPSSPPMPGFYRQVQRKGETNKNSGSTGNHTVSNSHTSFSARDTDLAPKLSLPRESEIESKAEQKESIFDSDDSMFEASDEYTVSDTHENIMPDDRHNSKEKSRDTSSRSSSNSKYLPESDDLLLLGLLILLMQNKGNEDLMMIIAMLLMT